MENEVSYESGPYLPSDLKAEMSSLLNVSLALSNVSDWLS
jgi:hypothetical protein